MEKENCIHYWIIDSQDIGRCKRCEAVRDFGALQRRTDLYRNYQAKLGAEKSTGKVRNPYGRRGKPIEYEEVL